MSGGLAPAGRKALRRLLVVEDDRWVREALEELLPEHGWAPVMAPTAGAALEALRGTTVVAMLLDLGLPDRDGVDLLVDLKKGWPHIPVVVLTTATSERRILAAIRAGAQGYLFKEDLSSRLTAALDEAMEGGAPMSRAVARLTLDQLRAPDRASSAPATPATPLTRRELEIVEQLARGLTYAQVGIVLEISANTVRSHIRTIYEKLAVASRTEAVMMALRLGWMPDRPV